MSLHLLRSARLRTSTAAHQVVRFRGSTRPINSPRCLLGLTSARKVAIANQEYFEKVPIVRYIMDHHISGEEAGAMFARLQPKLAAYTHLVFLGAPGYPVPTIDHLERKTREKYSGPLALGTDLMAFDVRKDEVIVIPDASKK